METPVADVVEVTRRSKTFWVWISFHARHTQLSEVVGALVYHGGGLYGRAFGGCGRMPAGGCSGKAIFHMVMSMHDHSVMVIAEAFNQKHLSYTTQHPS